METKWIGKSKTVVGLLAALAGAIWDQLSPADIDAASQAAQQVLEYGGLLIAAIGRLVADTKATLLPKL